MVEHGLQGRRRQGVHRVGPDQGVDVLQVRVGRVLGAGAGPQDALHPGPLRPQGREAGAAEEALEPLVGQPGVVHRGQPLQGRPAGTLLQEAVHQGVHPADEEAGHRGHPSQGAPPSPGREPLQPLHVGVGHLLVAVDVEEQGDVDVDPLRHRGADRRQPGLRARDLDHHVGALDRSPQALGVRDRPLGIVRQVRGDLQADVAVHPVQALVDGPQDVCGVADVPPGEGLEDLRRGHPGPGRLAQQVVVVRAAGDGLLEDGGVGRHPQQPLFDQALQLTGANQVAADAIQPDALAEGLQAVQGRLGPRRHRRRRGRRHRSSSLCVV